MIQDTITAFDAFCGAGGSSTGLKQAGIDVTLAANHWDLALETHAANHPHTQHNECDLMAAHPANFPSTTVAWFSPMCTSHSGSSGRKVLNRNQLNLWGEPTQTAAQIRSRASMREVVEFSAFHNYKVVMVENVVEVYKWEFYQEWLQAMMNLGYDYKTVYLNAMFFGVPQSRDRWYTVFWKKGNKAPNLDFQPEAVCEKHGHVHAIQVFKKSGYEWGKYDRQYTYACPLCQRRVLPATQAASTIIDWEMPITKIKDRTRPLNDKTMNRIRAGIRKFGTRPDVIDLGYRSGDRVYSIDKPMPTQTTHQTMMLAQPFISEMYGNVTNRSVNDPLGTVMTVQKHMLVNPSAFIGSYYGGRDAVASVNDPLPTITTFNNQHMLVEPGIDLSEVGVRMLQPSELKKGMSFPETYIILGSKGDQTTQIGNAVCPDVSYYIGAAVMESLQ